MRCCHGPVPNQKPVFIVRSLARPGRGGEKTSGKYGQTGGVGNSSGENHSRLNGKFGSLQGKNLQPGRCGQLSDSCPWISLIPHHLMICVKMPEPSRITGTALARICFLSRRSSYKEDQSMAGFSKVCVLVVLCAVSAIEGVAAPIPSEIPPPPTPVQAQEPPGPTALAAAPPPAPLFAPPPAGAAPAPQQPRRGPLRRLGQRIRHLFHHDG
jgi:hypothetical protein